ncbi:conserved hypothetical protein [Ricinus communis]|uniref:Uncharacterized protein n=1 Tax=Ricinus communis TaxID=3988 RepID=B9SZ27_RICCO|nr:conserved hypothetical protein [Ricinus communis]
MVCTGHDINADLLTSITDENLAQRFFRCHVRKGSRLCNSRPWFGVCSDDDRIFFEWLDRELPPFQKGAF